ncbi:hypothetical protein QCA50_004515 [Cerrena zonata]|uniref:O-methyltransferase C-terminal domain-containing protein n=1 Tax=Cerrena zonata TaxID=2478898 RepID=A0AAW0GHW6_9APHY
MEDTFTQLDQLVSLISSSVDYIKREFRASGQAIPSLKSIDEHPLDTGATSQKLLEALRIVHGASAQLTTMIAPPQYTLSNLSFAHYYSACLNVVNTAKVADHLRDYPEGLHVSRLAALTKLDGNQLARILRMLAIKHCFTEVTPDVFANNRLSIHLLSDSPVGALSGLLTDENYHAGASLTDTLLHPDPNFGNGSAFSRGLNFDGGGLWEFYQQVDPARGKRFDQAMVGHGAVIKFDAIVTGLSSKRCSSVPVLMFNLAGFPWRSQPDGTTVCDVGGGVGHVSMHIAKSCPQLRVILQDLPSVIEQAKLFWKEAAPKIMNEGRVQLLPINFLKESPITGCDYYFLKSVIHDWADKDSKVILTNIKNAMKPTSRLILHEFLIQHIAPVEGEAGRFFTRAPEPLLANYGDGRAFEYYSDICMMASCNAKERTLEEFVVLGRDCGLELVKVWECGQMNSIEFKLAGAS